MRNMGTLVQQNTAENTGPKIISMHHVHEYIPHFQENYSILHPEIDKIEHIAHKDLDKEDFVHSRHYQTIILQLTHPSPGLLSYAPTGQLGI